MSHLRECLSPLANDPSGTLNAYRWRSRWIRTRRALILTAVICAVGWALFITTAIVLWYRGCGV